MTIEKAISEIENEGLYGNQMHQETLELALAALREKAERERTGGWISVKDELPKKEGWYHVALLDTKTGKTYVEQDLYAIELAEKNHHERGFCKDGRWDGREVVTHWHYFPKPPKGAQE